jgi:hypothetical protein
MIHPIVEVARDRSGAPIGRRTVIGDPAAAAYEPVAHRPGVRSLTPNAIVQVQEQLATDTKDWHEFAMEWKEHIAWISPILATTVAFIVVYYGTQLIRHDRVRRTAIGLYVAAFAFAAVAGAFGAFITKVAPVV